ncbi:MAG: hypothetical protein WCF17_06475 [Terracidiphilus sp.]
MDSPSTTNPAVQRCLDAGRNAFEQEIAISTDKSKANCAAREAYRNALPHLSGQQNVQDFIACVADGVLRGMLYDSESTRLLYAAQVAVGALPRVPAPKPERKSAAVEAKKPPAADPASAAPGGVIAA